MAIDKRMRGICRALLPALLLLALPRLAEAQEVYIASWTIQDLDYNLQQELAVDIIERANEWLTRDNPEAPTARLDDRLRVTVVGEYNPTDGTVRGRLQRLNVGGLILDEDLREFLDSAITANILLRNYYWREEALTILDPSLSPQFYRNERQIIRADAPPSYDKAFGHAIPSHRMQSLSYAAVPITERANVWAGIGYEELGLPGLTYRRLRLGLESGGVRGWFEAPLPFSTETVLTGANQAAPGVGLSFELDRFGGGVTWSDPYAVSGMTNDTGALLNTSALLYGIVPIDYINAVDGWLRVKLGVGYLQGTQVGQDSTGIVAGRSHEFVYPFARGEFVSLRKDGTKERGANVQIFGGSILASYYQRFSDLLGIEVSGAVNGIIGERPPFLSGTGVWVSPVIFLK